MATWGGSAWAPISRRRDHPAVALDREHVRETRVHDDGAAVVADGAHR